MKFGQRALAIFWLALAVGIMAPAYAQEDAQLIGVNERFNGFLNDNNESDLYQVDISEAAWLDISVRATGGGLDTKVELLDGNQNQLEVDDDGGDGASSRIEDFFFAPGRYYIRVFRFSERSSGSYQILLTRESPALIEANEFRQGSLNLSNTSDLFQLEIRQFSSLEISMERMSDEMDPYLVLKDSNGQELLQDDDDGEGQNALISDDDIAPGKYFISAQMYSGNDQNSGLYALRVSLTSRGDSAQIPGAQGTQRIGLNERFNGFLNNNNESDLYQLEMSDDAWLDISVEATGGNLDPTVELLNPDMEQLAYNDDGGEGKNSLIDDFRAFPGTYFLRVNRYSGAQEGSYAISVAREWPQNYEIGATATGTLDAANTSDIYLLVIGARISLNLSLERAGENLDPVLSVLDGAGETLAHDDDGGENSNSLIADLSLDAGVYYIRARRYSESSAGAYHLTVEYADAQPGGSQVSAPLPNLADLSSFVNYSVGKGYAIRDLTCGGNDTWFILQLDGGALSDYVSLAITVGAEGDAAFPHVLPLPIRERSAWDYAAEAGMEIGMFASTALLHELPFASFVIEGAETFYAVGEIMAEYEEEQRRRTQQELGALRLALKRSTPAAGLLIHAAHDSGYVSLQARYFVDDDDMHRWRMAAGNVTEPPNRPFVLTLPEALCQR